MGRMRYHHWITVLAVAWSAVGSPPNLVAQDSPHGQTTRPLECAGCHTQDAWRPVREPMRFDHTADTEYALEGRHADATCGGCHIGWNFSEPQVGASECSACHVDVHLGNLSTDCTACHTTESFQDLPTLEVHLRTAFPLTGSHLQVSCESCHVDDTGGMFTTLNPDCFACHQEEYENTSSIDHVTSGFPTDCISCHNTIAFGVGVVFEHAVAANGFRLLGAHDRIPCAACHILPGFESLFLVTDDQDCIGCHQMEFDQEHFAAGFPTNCLTCHSVETWEGARVNHPEVSNGFRLLGAHDRIECTACHVLPGFESVFPVTEDQDCIGCHQTEFETTPSIDHVGSGFPTTCLACHTVETWEGATFADHDPQFFPIFSGPHRDKWTGCIDCHEVPNDFASFTCLSCHDHNQADMDDKHSGETDYVYESSACLDCHPDGRHE